MRPKRTGREAPNNIRQTRNATGHSSGAGPHLPPELASSYAEIRPEIEARLAEFDRLWAGGSEVALFEELAFCLFTPQSKAYSCWAAVERLRRCGLLLEGNAPDVSTALSGVRFHNNKAQYLVDARRTFAPDGRPAVRRVLKPLGSPADMREWLVQNVDGYGYKEASHFLRNVGLGRELAILDRHILRNLVRTRVIAEVPHTMTKTRYLMTEAAMSNFCRAVDVPLAHMDFLLWHKEAGSVFK